MASKLSASLSAPVPLAIARSMLSLGIEASLAFWTASASAGLPSMSAPPSLAATVMARASFVNSFPRRRIAAMATVPEQIFKAYDVRGLYGDEIDADIAEQVGRAFVRVLAD